VQMEYNKKHNITPRGIKKAIIDVMESARPGSPATPEHFAKVAEERAKYAALTPKQLAAQLKKLEKQMFKHAQELEFEEAAKVRDELEKLREHALIGVN